MAKRCIVNVAMSERYGPLQDRLVRSVCSFPAPPHMFWWRDELPPGAPQGFPLPYKAYMAKPFAMTHAMNDGWEIVAWMDAACYAIKDPAPFFEHVEKEGYYFQDNGAKMGEWCSDAALHTLGFTRDEALQVTECSSMVIALDLRRPECRQFLSEWQRLAGDGVTFPGEHTNDVGPARQRGVAYRATGHVSDDRRVLGHRHDQTAASALIHRFGFKMTPRPIWVNYREEPTDPRTIFVNNGGL